MSKRRGSGWRGWIVGWAIGLMALPLGARADALLDQTVAFSGTILHLQTGVPGLVLGAVRDGEIAVAGFGETAEGNGTPPDGDTVLRIGSITKVFAGQMLAHAVVRGEARFTDPVAPLLPAPLSQALADHPPIRLIDLSTHAAGLPREVPREDGPANDPFRGITAQAFADWLAENSLLFQPGTAISYSNFGFDLLSSALSRAAGRPYPQLLRERITGPLQMDDTGFLPDERMAARLMTGHAPDGTPLPQVPSGDVITGSAGLFSTANDLLRWMEWHLADGGADAEIRLLDQAVYLPRDGLDQVLAMDESGRMDGMGLGWVAMQATDRRPFMLQKAGALQGQMSYIAFAPGHGTAVFVSINQFDFAAAFAMTAMANDLLAELSGF